MRAIRERTTLLAEDAKVADRLLGLLADVDCRGKQVHDANLVATMLVHGIGTVVTMNLEDFARFEPACKFDPAIARLAAQLVTSPGSAAPEGGCMRDGANC